MLFRSLLFKLFSVEVSFGVLWNSQCIFGNVNWCCFCVCGSPVVLFLPLVFLTVSVMAVMSNFIKIYAFYIMWEFFVFVAEVLCVATIVACCIFLIFAVFGDVTVFVTCKALEWLGDIWFYLYIQESNFDKFWELVCGKCEKHSTCVVCGAIECFCVKSGIYDFLDFEVLFDPHGGYRMLLWRLCMCWVNYVLIFLCLHLWYAWVWSSSLPVFFLSNFMRMSPLLRILHESCFCLAMFVNAVSSISRFCG